MALPDTLSRDRGTALLGLGVALFVVTMLASAAMAPGGIGPNDDRQTLVGVQGGGVDWHEHGNVHLVTGSTVDWMEESADSYFDVTMTDDGTVLAGFMDGGYEDCGPYESPCVHSGFRIIDPAGPSVVSEYSFPVRTAKDSEVHDVEHLGEGEYLLTDMEYERIFAVRDGEITWQWNASSIYDAPEDPTRTDWLHINDVDVIESGRYLVSVRNANQLVVVERGEGVVEIVNEDTDDSDDGSCTKPRQLADTDGDGDVRCGDPDLFNHQHNPQMLTEDAVLVADSDNNRIIELHRVKGDWEIAWRMESALGTGFHFPRDADRLPNGKTLITDSVNRRILEVNASGDVLWRHTMSRIPYEADRLPGGEDAVGAPYGNVTSPGGDAGKLPLLSPAIVGLRSVAAWLPLWYAEEQLLVTVVSLVLVVGGGIDRWRGEEQ